MIDGAELQPVFDPCLRVFSVNLSKDGKYAGNFGMHEVIAYADEVVEDVNPFLDQHGVRPLTLPEMVHLYGALLAAKNPHGPDFLLFRMEFERGQQQN
ncbi:hypothetical protein [Streptomyces sp. NBC_01205]|uniref:hypothetical protein n=1 Tax=Streptomyces sp. NBC_01205 TaxID=2903771 RepID=UPI002E0EBE34|nr:hypothetical protein OG573_43165 [Streptomyces sp. NBC_01205]